MIKLVLVDVGPSISLVQQMRGSCDVSVNTKSDLAATIIAGKCLASISSSCFEVCWTAVCYFDPDAMPMPPAHPKLGLAT